MALNTCELLFNGIKTTSFFYKKLHSGWGLSPQTNPRPPPVMSLSNTNLLKTSPNLHLCFFVFDLSPLPIAKSWLRASTQATASDFPIYNIFVPQKVPLSKISEDVITCDLVPPPTKHPGYIYAPGCACTPAIGYFQDKTKISKEFLRVDYYLSLKYSKRQ